MQGLNQLVLPVVLANQAGAAWLKFGADTLRFTLEMHTIQRHWMKILFRM